MSAVPSFRKLLDVLPPLNFSKAFIAKRLDFDHYDAIKGVLILLIIIGHTRSYNPDLLNVKRWLYSFHAPLFLLIAFILPAPQWSWEGVVKRARRYFIPVLWFSAFAFLIFNFLYRADASLEGLTTSSVNYVLALLTGSYYFFDVSTGFEAFWFMHALFGIFLFRSISSLSGVGGSLFLWVCATALVFIGRYFLQGVLHYIPNILTVSSYCIMISYPVYVVVNFLCFRLNHAFGLALSLLLFGGMSAHYLQHVTAANFSNIYNIAHLKLPETLMLSVMYVFHLGSAFAVIVWLTKLKEVQSIFKSIGALSFEIYLIHLFVLFILESLWTQFATRPEALLPLIIVIFLTGVISYVIARILRRIPFLHRRIFVR